MSEAALASPIEQVGPDAVVLWVGVHREAGTLGDVAADGASGLCTAEVTWIRCPARTGPVTFRWGNPGVGAWALSVRGADGGWTEGPVTLEPGHGAVAAVLPASSARAAERARLEPSVVTPADVRELFVRTGDHAVFPPSAAELSALAALAEHADPRVRRELPDALLPWLRHTAEDPMPPGSPPVVPAGTLLALAHDGDPAVRRRLASRLRDVRDGEQVAAEVTAALSWLVTTGGGAQRAALVAMGSRSKEGSSPALDAWRVARVRLRDPGPPGRAAVKTLSALATELDPGGEVDPAAVLRDVLAFHPERTWSFWNAWRRDVPIDQQVLVRLFRDTVGWSPGLLGWWGRTSPDELEAAFVAWEPGPPHSERYADLLAGLALSADPRWARLRGDNLSGEAPPPPAP